MAVDTYVEITQLKPRLWRVRIVNEVADTSYRTIGANKFARTEARARVKGRRLLAKWRKKQQAPLTGTYRFR